MWSESMKTDSSLAFKCSKYNGNFPRQVACVSVSWEQRFLIKGGYDIEKSEKCQNSCGNEKYFEYSDEPDEPDEPEDTYDDDGGGIYGEIESDEDDVTSMGEIQGLGAKILNLHASYQGFLREEGFFKSSRWWCLVYNKGGTTLLL